MLSHLQSPMFFNRGGELIFALFSGRLSIVYNIVDHVVIHFVYQIIYNMVYNLRTKPCQLPPLRLLNSRPLLVTATCRPFRGYRHGLYRRYTTSLPSSLC